MDSISAGNSNQGVKKPDAGKNGPDRRNSGSPAKPHREHGQHVRTTMPPSALPAPRQMLPNALPVSGLTRKTGPRINPEKKPTDDAFTERGAEKFDNLNKARKELKNAGEGKNEEINGKKRAGGSKS
ncbi:MAG: hypothetical protein ACLFQV_10145 [Vulcanimicrobiota bacterium]